MLSIKTIFFIVAMIIALPTWASTPTFSGLTDADMKTISQEFSAIFVHTSASPPTKSLLGVEVSLLAGVTSVPGIKAISQRVDPSTNVNYAPYAMLYGAVGIPMTGLTIEANILPSVTNSGFKLSHYGGAVRYSLTDSILPMLPFNLSLRSFYSQSTMDFNEYVNPANIAVNFKSSMFGVESLFGLNLIVVEPYAGIGYVTSSSTLKGTSNPVAPIFADGSTSKSTSVNSTRLIGGVQFNILMLKLGLEYNRVFNTDRYIFKAGLAF